PRGTAARPDAVAVRGRRSRLPAVRASALLGDLVDLGDLVRRQRPVGGLGVGLDLLGLGGSGYHARHLGPRQEPGKRKFEKSMAPAFAELRELVDDVVIGVAQEPRRQRRLRRKPAGGLLILVAAVLAGQRAARQREERQDAEPVF